MSESEPAESRVWRPSFQLSLRAWLIVVTIAAAVVGWQSRRVALTPRNVASMSEVASIDEDIWEIAWSPERDRVALLGWEKPAQIRDVLSFRKLETIGEGQKLIHFAFSPDRDVVGYSRNGKTAEILHRKEGRTVTLDVGDDQPSVTFSPDGQTVVTGGYGTRVRLWRVSDGQPLRDFAVGPNVGGLT